MKRFLLSIFILIGLSLISMSSFALGKLGHQVICQLAFEHLPVSKQEKITQLLANVPEKHQELINHYNYKKKGSVITFASACTWADAIKRAEEFKNYNNWHYLNVPRNQSTITADICQENCLPQGILHHQRMISKGDSEKTWSQAKALMFLGHWLGDIHQPLHVSFASDLGGNRVKLAHLGNKCSSLHWYWDDCILYRGKNSKAQWLDLLNSQWKKDFPDWQSEQVWEWANESFQIVKTPSFNYCQMDNQGNCLQPKQKVTLPQNYLTQHQGIMEQRLLLAAQRLNQILSASL